MLPHLLATHPDTSPGTLVALVTADTNSATTGAALLHPNMPPEAPLGASNSLGALDAHEVLKCPRTTAARRAQILGGMGRGELAALIRDYTDLSTAEITEHYGTFSAGPGMAAALARNPHTAPQLVADALRYLATRGEVEGLALAILAHERNASPELLAELANLCAKTSTGRSFTPRPGDSRDLYERALALKGIDLGPVIRQTRSVELMKRALPLGKVNSTIGSALPPDHPHDDLRALMPFRGPRAISDEATLELLAAGPHGGYFNLEDALTHPHLAPDTLRTVAEELIDNLTHAAGVGYDDQASIREALLEVAAHPSCPVDLLPLIAPHTQDTTEPNPEDDWRDNRITYHLARARLGGDPHFARAIPMHLLRERARFTANYVNGHQLQAHLLARPTWPLARTQAVACLALYPTFTGTLGELLDAVDAVTT